MSFRYFIFKKEISTEAGLWRICGIHKNTWMFYISAKTETLKWTELTSCQSLSVNTVLQLPVDARQPPSSHLGLFTGHLWSWRSSQPVPFCQHPLSSVAPLIRWDCSPDTSLTLEEGDLIREHFLFSFSFLDFFTYNNKKNSQIIWLLSDILNQNKATTRLNSYICVIYETWWWL